MGNLKNYLNSYEFTAVLPGSEKEITYKGLTTNLVKKLLVYEEETDPLKQEDIFDVIIENAVVNEDFKIDKQYILDRYYLFIKIREATKGSYYSFQWKCPKCESQFLQTIDLQELEIKKPEKIEDKLELSSGVIFYLDFPIREKQKEVYSYIDKKLSEKEKEIQLQIADIASHVTKIESPEGKEEKFDYNELIDFIGELPENELDKFNEWKEKNAFGFNFMKEIKCKSCEYTEKQIIPLTNFFN